MNLSEQVSAIQTRSDLAIFIRAILRDFREAPNGWENRDLESYLEALAAWVEDMEGYYQNRGEIVPDQPVWMTLGQMLLAARIYE